MTPKERPVLFSGDLVRAMLDGRKTTTRRPVVLNEEAARIASHPTARWGFTVASSERRHLNRWSVGMEDPNGSTFSDRRETKVSGIACPLGNAGDLLYVRETWALSTGSAQTSDCFVRYRADGSGLPLHVHGVADKYGANLSASTRWRPSIHMPKWAARIWLRVTDVRVERVQDITNEGAEAEGMVAGFDSMRGWTVRTAFEETWNSLYGDWAANPWVWVVDFEVLSTTGRP